MGVAVDGGAAGVDADGAGRGGFDGFDPFGQGVVDVQHGGAPFWRMGVVYHGGAGGATPVGGRIWGGGWVFGGEIGFPGVIINGMYALWRV